MKTINTNEFKFYCSGCDQPLKCEPQFAGRQIQCPACNLLNADICHAFTADIHLSRFGANIENYTSAGVDTPISGVLQTTSTNLFFARRISDGSFVFSFNLQNKNPEIANQIFSYSSDTGGATLMLKLQHTPQ